jgi:hypothetical protein
MMPAGLTLKYLMDLAERRPINPLPKREELIFTDAG